MTTRRFGSIPICARQTREIMAEIFRVAVSREHRIVGLISVSDSGGVSATADGRRVVWRAQPDRLDDSAWRTLEYLAGMTRRVDEYGTSDGEDPLGYDTSLPTEVYLRQMAEDALTGRYARAVESEMARFRRVLDLPTPAVTPAHRLRRWISHRYWRTRFWIRDHLR
jgi:hypothetical protein